MLSIFAAILFTIRHNHVRFFKSNLDTIPSVSANCKRQKPGCQCVLRTADRPRIDTTVLSLRTTHLHPTKQAEISDLFMFCDKANLNLRHICVTKGLARMRNEDKKLHEAL